MPHGKIANRYCLILRNLFDRIGFNKQTRIPNSTLCVPNNKVLDYNCQSSGCCQEMQSFLVACSALHEKQTSTNFVKQTNDLLKGTLSSNNYRGAFPASIVLSEGKRVKRNIRRRPNRRLCMKYRQFVNKRQKPVSIGEMTIISSRKKELQRKKLTECHQRSKADQSKLWVKASGSTGTSSSGSRTNPSSQAEIQENHFPALSKHACDLNNIIADLLIPPGSLVIQNSIITGTFGKLRAAKFDVSSSRRIRIPQKPRKVLVKVISSDATQSQIEQFQKDACRFAGIRMPHLSTVIAACHLPDRSLYGDFNSSPTVGLVYLFHQNGNLKIYLKNQMAENHDGMSNNNLTIDLAVRMAIDLLSAMNHLHEMHIVHGDIATRNCFLSKDLRLLLSDCALSRDMFPEDYDCLGDNTNRPIRWMPLEAMIEHKFNTNTDIWSFGITLWELVTRCQRPYDEYDGLALPQLLVVGYRMPQPYNCPDELWQIVSSCWHSNPARRPTVDLLSKQLDQFFDIIDSFI